MPASFEKPSNPDTPYCRRHHIIGKPGEEWFGWRCEHCEAERRRRAEFRRLPRDLWEMITSIGKLLLLMISIFFPWILLSMLAIGIIVLLWHYR